MNAWRGFWAVPAAVIAAGALAIASPSTSVLENLHGVVQYLAASGAPARPLAPKASAAISDDDVAQTGSGSMAMITLADSSQITMASNSTLKLDTFSASQVARALQGRAPGWSARRLHLYDADRRDRRAGDGR
jgi:ferric-dicitrate binding protein FerR (iron transport regulator)